MSRFELAASIIAIFFIAGMVLGVLLVTVLPRFRRRNDRRHLYGGE